MMIQIDYGFNIERPIAIGLTLPRLVSKIASRWAMEYFVPELAPR